MSSNGPRISPLSFEYKCPRLSLFIIMSSPENQQNRIDILFYYSMHEYSGILACFEHSNFFKVNLLASRDTRSRAPLNLQQKHSLQSSKTTKLTASRLLRSNYELFNHNNFNIRYWSWNYRGCWHQTCPPIDPRETVLKCTHSNYKASDESCIVIFRHYLELRSLGNLRACCLPWMW